MLGTRLLTLNVGNLSVQRGDYMYIHKLLTKTKFYPGALSRIKYIVIHYTGSTGSAEANARYLVEGDRTASAHYFVGFDGEIWQCVEDKDSAWHCGAASYKHPECRNQNSIAIELCARTIGDKTKADDKWYFEDATVNSAIEITRELMKRYNVPPQNVLRHYDVTGKVCPAPYVFNNTNHTWEKFKMAISDIDRAKVIWNYLTMSCRFSECSTAGIMGNLYAESGLNPLNLQNSFNKKLNLTDEEYTNLVDIGAYSKEEFVYDKAGYGLAQWTFWDRKKKLYDFVKASNVSIGSLTSQLAFFFNEIQGYSSLMKTLKEAKTVREASDAFLHQYERPADQSEAVELKRAGYGQTFYDLYATGSDISMSFKPFLVRVNITNLCIRKGPGVNFDKTGGHTGKGVFTIVEEQNGWGKLKSGLGWISLNYAKRV